jgi:predicted metal-dependent peptidase
VCNAITNHLTHAVRIQKARTALLLDHPFFGSLLFRLGGRASGSIQTMATDGVTLFYNPAFVETLNAAELAGVLAHEVMHPGLQHHTRRGDRDRKRWNMACDYAINPLLLDAGLTLPKDVLIDRRFRGMSAERIYNLIEERRDQDGSNGERENQDGASSDGASRKQVDSPNADSEPTAPTIPGGFGQLLDAPEPEGDDGDTVAEQTREWKIAVEQAENVAKLAGKLPVGVNRSFEQSEPAGVDWRELLRRAWSETIPSDYSWMPPNRRHIWAGLYLPGVRCEGAGEIAIAVDYSGSIMHASWVSSSRKSAPFSKDIDRAGCMCSTSIPRSIRPRFIKQDSLSHLPRLAEEERTSSPAFGERGIVPQTMVPYRPVRRIS